MISTYPWTLVGVYCAALASLLAPPVFVAASEALGATAWATETFVDVTEHDGQVLSVELRRSCGASVHTTARAFCEEFEVSPSECERLAAFLDDATQPVERRKKLGSFSLNVDDRSTGVSKRIKIAIHEGDTAVLDSRMRYLCDRFELVGDSCPLLRRHLESQILELELANAREHFRRVSDHELFPSIDRGADIYERIVAHLLHDRRELSAIVEDKARAYKRLRENSKRESLELTRRVRLLETQVARFDLRSPVPKPPPNEDQVRDKASTMIHGGRAQRIARVHAANCSYSEYLRLARSSTPVIFTGFRDLPRSPGLPDWTFESLLNQCGQTHVRLKKSVFGADADADKVSLASMHYWAGMVPASESTLAAFLANLADDNSSELYLHDVSIASFCPALLDTFYVPRFFAEDWMQRVYNAYDGSVDFDDVGIQQRDYWPSLFIGGEATASSLHGDWGGTAAWMGLLQGRKHWVIASPSARAVLHEEVPTASKPAPGRFSADLMRKYISESSDVQWTDVLRKDELFEDVLEAGEVLFVPADCPHQVRNLETTIAVAANYVDSANAYHFGAFLCQEMLSSSGDKHRALANVLADLEAIEAERLPHNEKDLSYLEFKEQQRRRPSRHTHA